jgi:DNA-directed RNA polymerase specialized sigma24 family protein
MDEPRDHVDDRFQRFYRDNFTHTARLARLLTNRPDVADDLAQDAFVRVYRYAQNADRPIDNPAALLRTTTVNVCRSWHTSQKRLLRQWRQRRSEEDPEFDPHDPSGHVFGRPDGTPTHPQLLSDAFKKLVARSGLPPIRFSRPPPHPRHPAPQGWRAGQGRLRTARALHPRVHHGHLPTRHPRHATRSRTHLRAASPRRGLMPHRRQRSLRPPTSTR